MKALRSRSSRLSPFRRFEPVSLNQLTAGRGSFEKALGLRTETIVLELPLSSSTGPPENQRIESQQERGRAPHLSQPGEAQRGLFILQRLSPHTVTALLGFPTPSPPPRRRAQKHPEAEARGRPGALRAVVTCTSARGAPRCPGCGGMPGRGRALTPAQTHPSRLGPAPASHPGRRDPHRTHRPRGPPAQRMAPNCHPPARPLPPRRHTPLESPQAPHPPRVFRRPELALPAALAAGLQLKAEGARHWRETTEFNDTLGFLLPPSSL